jgi:hypothetical protein
MTKTLSAIVLLAIVVAGCTTQSVQTVPAISSSAQRRDSRVVDEASWRNALVRTALPDAGCFKTTYPSVTWTRVPCSMVTHGAFPPDPRRLVHPAQIGGAGGQVEAAVNSPASIEEAVGSFPSVTHVRSEHSVPAGGGKPFGPNTFSLQMNSQFFPTAACGANASCLGWEQFVFANGSSERQPSQLFIQDWLVATGTSTLTCPRGWTQSKKSCVYNSKVANVPNAPIATLGTLKLWGYAMAAGDSVFLAIGAKAYGVRNAQSDGTVDLAGNWSRVQFNVLGDGGGSVAVFNPGSSLTVQLEVATAHTRMTPLCVLTQSTTAESDTLDYSSIRATPQAAQFPSIVFGESNASNRGNAQCETLGAT